MKRTRLMALVAAASLYALLQLGSIGHPLFWQDEGETAMFGRRVLDHGYPKVHGAEGVVYGMGLPLEVAVDAETDAYLGSLWGQYYLAAAGVAWSAGHDDPYARTARVRLPFVLSGVLGLALLVGAFRGPLAGRSGSALPAATAFLLLLCASTSLQLHLREVRYYGPMVAGVGIAVALVRALGRGGGGRLREVLLAAALAVDLVVLLNVFFPAAAATMAWIVGEAALDRLRARRGPGAAGRRDATATRRTLALLAPVAVAAAVGIHLAMRFDLLAVSGALAERWSFGPALYLGNLGHLLVYLLRWEWLPLVLLLEGALRLTRSGAAPDEPARGAALVLLRLAAWLGLVGSANPIFFERYFVAVGPVLALAAVLDGEVLLARLSAAAPGAPSRRRVFAVLGIAVAAMLAVRGGELSGRVREIVAPVEGPIDRIVSVLSSEHPRPEQLVLATNYEAEPLMFYLGSRVVGRFHAADAERIRTERLERPDVVIPRTGHPKRLGEVRRYLLAGGYASRILDVADTPYNSLPELYRGRVLDRTHWFAAPVPGGSDPALVVYTRRAERP